MAYEVKEAKELVIKAGLELMEKGLIARTWGNVSARISDTQFVITPSGIPYEDLTPEKIVVVNIADCEYEGDVKPSSEKGVHADAYRLRPDVNFVIHTHQTAASVASIRSNNISNLPEECSVVIGPMIPIAEYGISSTKTLRENVAKVVGSYNACKAVLMKHHGAVCLGKDYDEAFAVADALEKACQADIAKAVQAKGGADKGYADLADVFTETVVPEADRSIALQDLGSSKRTADGFVLTMKDGSTYDCTPYGNAKAGIAPRCATVHAEIYRNTDVKFISQYTAPEAVAVSKEGVDEPLYFDDFVQIAGFSVKNCGWDKSSYRKQAIAIGKAARGTNAVFVKGQGALCTANNEYDAKAVELVLEKECRAHLLAGLVNDADTIAKVGGILERVVYVAKYSKQADK